MSIFLRLEKKNFKTRETAGKWYAKATPLMTAHTEDLAKSISDSATFTKADVEGVITALVEEMKQRLQDGQKVVLDNFGAFSIAVHSDGVDNPDDFDLKRHVRKPFCKFTPAGRRNQQLGRRIVRNFLENVKWTWSPQWKEIRKK
jgi:predicted histone-like DNA-binding protein